MKEPEVLYFYLFHKSPVGMAIIRAADRKFADVNDTFLKLFGFKREDVINYTPVELSILTSERFEEIVSKQTNINEPVYDETEVFTRNRRKINLLISYSIYQSGEEQYILTTFSDISDKKVLENSVKQSEEKLRKVLDTINNPVVISRLSDGLIIDANESFMKISGIKPEDISAKTSFLPDIWLKPDDKKNYLEELRKKRYVKNFHTSLVINSGEVHDFEINGEILNLNNEDYVISCLYDVTELLALKNKIISLNKEMEQKVKERTKQLESINTQLETFTYSVSHDLKAPLRGIEGYCKLLYDSCRNKLDEESKFFLEQIRDLTLKMVQLINDLLEYSRLERSSLRMEKISVKELISTLMSYYKNDLELGNFNIVINIPDIEIVTDLKIFTIAFRNIIDNARKFTLNVPKPEILINFKDDELFWIISVSDNGIGFDMKYHDKIFEIFQRLQRMEDYPGSGIGLAMVKKAMERLGGKIWAESIPGSGSTFYIALPKKY